MPESRRNKNEGHGVTTDPLELEVFQNEGMRNIIPGHGIRA
jgi:hypothetical protein